MPHPRKCPVSVCSTTCSDTDSWFIMVWCQTWLLRSGFNVCAGGNGFFFCCLFTLRQKFNCMTNSWHMIFFPSSSLLAQNRTDAVYKTVPWLCTEESGEGSFFKNIAPKFVSCCESSHLNKLACACTPGTSSLDFYCYNEPSWQKRIFTMTQSIYELFTSHIGYWSVCQWGTRRMDSSNQEQTRAQVNYWVLWSNIWSVICFCLLTSGATNRKQPKEAVRCEYWKNNKYILLLHKVLAIKMRPIHKKIMYKYVDYHFERFRVNVFYFENPYKNSKFLSH